jgi:hypothetical protein
MEQFKLTRYVTEKMTGYRKGQFVNTREHGVGIVEDVIFEHISDGWSFGLQSEYGWKCVAICRTATEDEKAIFAQKQAERAAAEMKQAERKAALEHLNRAATRARAQGTRVERDDIQGQTTRVQVRQDGYHNFYFLIGEVSIWYVEVREVYPSIWRLDYDAHLAEELQKLNSILA